MIKFQKIRWKNFLSYGDNYTCIDLQKRPSTLIVGTNGSGKSAVLDVLTYVLFGKSFRRVNLPQLINTINEKELVAEAKFQVGKNNYLIRRGMKPKLFEIFKNGILQQQDAKRKDYQEQLEKNVLGMNYKSFTQVVVLGSSTFIPFMQLNPRDRRVIIEDILDIEIFSLMNMILKQRISECKSSQSETETNTTINDNKIDVQKKYIADLRKNKREEIKNIEKKIGENEAQNTSILKKIKRLQGKSEVLLIGTEGLEKFQRRLKQVYKLQTHLASNLKKIKSDLDFFYENDTCPTCQQDIDGEFKEKATFLKESTKKDLERGLVKLKKECSGVEEELSGIAETQSKIAELQLKISEHNSTLLAIKQFVTKLEKQIIELNKPSGSIEEASETLKGYKTEKRKIDEECMCLSEKKRLMDAAYELLKDGGIKTTIVKQYLPVINQLVNKYLSLMNFFINFNLDENFDESIKSRHRDDFSYHSFSEGEKQRIDLSLLFTWREIARMKNSVHTNLLILDEIFDSSLDASGVDDFLKIIAALPDDVNAFVISHKGDLFEDKFQETIKFEKKGNFSKMVK